MSHSVEMADVKLTRENAVYFLYKIELVKTCRHDEHRKILGPPNDQWFADMEGAIHFYASWFHECGHSLYNGTVADCCGFAVKLRIKQNSEF